MTIKETINNVLHANENAEKVKREAKRAHRNAVIGTTGIISTAIGSIVLHYKWTNKIKALQDVRDDDLNAKIKDLEEQCIALEAEVLRMRGESNNDN